VTRRTSRRRVNAAAPHWAAVRAAFMPQGGTNTAADYAPALTPDLFVWFDLFGDAAGDSVWPYIPLSRTTTSGLRGEPHDGMTFQTYSLWDGRLRVYR